MTKRIQCCSKLSLLLLLASAPVLAAETDNSPSISFANALVTDRPDAAESSLTVGARRFQLETGIGFTYDAAAGAHTKTFGMPTLFRYGLVDPVELRLEGELFNAVLARNDQAAVGASDLAMGTKIHFTDGGGPMPSLGVLFHVSMPIGSDANTSGAWEPSLKWLSDWEFPAGFSLGTNAGIDIPARDAAGDRFSRFLYAASLGFAIPGLEDRFRLFVEGTGAMPLRTDKAMEHQFDTGLTFLLTPNLQIDTLVQIGLVSASPDLTAGLGFSWRI